MACDDSSDVKNIKQIVLQICEHWWSQEEIIEVVRQKGRTWKDDICEAVEGCLKTKEINTSHIVSVVGMGHRVWEYRMGL